LSFYIYLFSLILLVGVMFFGKSHMGAQRWIHFPGFNFQPSEFSKLATLILLARLFSHELKITRSSVVNRIFLPLSLIGLSAVLIFKQPDLGTAAMIIFLFFMVALISRVERKYVIGIIIVSLCIVPFGWSKLKGYQKKRLTVFINPNIDPLGAGYTTIQSKIAIGSGKVLGKGFLSGTQNQFNFMPERHTDFIFTVIAEEFGFLGCMGLFFIYFLILTNITQRITRLKDSFAQILCVGIFSTIFLHLFINIGMTIGLLPIVGLPLLFLSYGGTHLIVSALLLGIYMNIIKQC